MSIENQLDLLIEALDKNTAAANQLADRLSNAVEEPTAPEKPKTYVQERKAEVAAEKDRPRGKQALKSALVKKEPEPVVEETDDFLGDDPVPEEPESKVEVTLDDVRLALVEYRKAAIAELGDEKGKASAMALLAKHGGGAKVLPNPHTKAEDRPLALRPEFYAAVLKAVQA